MSAYTLAVSVIHAAFSPERRDMLVNLVDSLGGPKAIRDWTMAFHVQSDWVGVGTWPAAYGAWIAAVESGASHVLVLSDDAIAAPDAFAAIHECMAILPDSCISLYINNKVAEEALEKQVHWITSLGACWGLATLMPSWMALRWLQWSQSNIPHEYPHDDARISAWLTLNNEPTWLTMPCMFDHVGDGKSLLGHKTPIPQRARVFSTRSLLEIDWERDIPNPVRGRPNYRGEKEWLKTLKP